MPQSGPFRGGATTRLMTTMPLTRPIAIAVLALIAACTALTAQTPEDVPQVRVTTETSGTSTRVIVTAPRPLPARVRATERGVEVVFDAGVQLAPERQWVADGVLEHWRAEGDRRLVLATGEGFERHETFELRNPWRLVVELRGRHVAGGGATGSTQPRQGPIVVIDPGHGGAEEGAIGPSGTKEKDLTLDLARRLAAVLERDGAVDAILTREDDRHVPLDARTALANQHRAQLFVSIHLNASRGRSASGAETYYLAIDATDDEARTLAALENRAYQATVEPASVEPPDPGDRSLELILWDLAQNQYLAESSRLAESVQRQLNALAGTRNRGVRQAPFRVLMGATMPAILVEVGFISNPAEETRMKDGAHRDRIVEAIARAIGEYRSGLEQVAQAGSR